MANQNAMRMIPRVCPDESWALLVGGDIWVPSNEMDKKQGGWSSTKDNKKCNRGEIIDIEHLI